MRSRRRGAYHSSCDGESSFLTRDDSCRRQHQLHNYHQPSYNYSDGPSAPIISILDAAIPTLAAHDGSADRLGRRRLEDESCETEGHQRPPSSGGQRRCRCQQPARRHPLQNNSQKVTRRLRRRPRPRPRRRRCKRDDGLSQNTSRGAMALLLGLLSMTLYAPSSGAAAAQSAGGYLTRPASRNYLAYQHNSILPSSSHPLTSLPQMEDSPHELNSGHTCGVIQSRDYNMPMNRAGTMLPLNVQEIYVMGGTINVGVSLVNNPQSSSSSGGGGGGGYFEFSACPLRYPDRPTEGCFMKYPLEFVADDYYGVVKNEEYPHRAYLPSPSAFKDGSIRPVTSSEIGPVGGGSATTEYSYTFKLPEDALELNTDLGTLEVHGVPNGDSGSTTFTTTTTTTGTGGGGVRRGRQRALQGAGDAPSSPSTSTSGGTMSTSGEQQGEAEEGPIWFSQQAGDQFTPSDEETVLISALITDGNGTTTIMTLNGDVTVINGGAHVQASTAFTFGSASTYGTGIDLSLLPEGVLPPGGIGGGGASATAAQPEPNSSAADSFVSITDPLWATGNYQYGNDPLWAVGSLEGANDQPQPTADGMTPNVAPSAITTSPDQKYVLLRWHYVPDDGTVEYWNCAEVLVLGPEGTTGTNGVGSDGGDTYGPLPLQDAVVAAATHPPLPTHPPLSGNDAVQGGQEVADPSSLPQGQVPIPQDPIDVSGIDFGSTTTNEEPPETEPTDDEDDATAVVEEDPEDTGSSNGAGEGIYIDVLANDEDYDDEDLAVVPDNSAADAFASLKPQGIAQTLVTTEDEVEDEIDQAEPEDEQHQATNKPKDDEEEDSTTNGLPEGLEVSTETNGLPEGLEVSTENDGEDTSSPSSSLHMVYAEDERAVTPKNKPTVVDVTHNDFSQGMDKLVLRHTGGAEHGHCKITADNKLEYSPNVDFVGTDYCGYEVCQDKSQDPMCDEAILAVKVVGKTAAAKPSSGLVSNHVPSGGLSDWIVNCQDNDQGGGRNLLRGHDGSKRRRLPDNASCVGSSLVTTVATNNEEEKVTFTSTYHKEERSSSLYSPTLRSSLSQGDEGRPYIDTVVTITASADAVVMPGFPDKCFGRTPMMLVSSASSVTGLHETLLRFETSGVDMSLCNGGVVSANIFLYSLAKSNQGGKFITTSHRTWSEDEVTWNTAPKANGMVLTGLSSSSIEANQWYGVDVLPALTIGKTLGIRMLAEEGEDSVAQYASKDHSDESLKPTLNITCLSLDVGGGTDQ